MAQAAACQNRSHFPVRGKSVHKAILPFLGTIFRAHHPKIYPNIFDPRQDFQPDSKKSYPFAKKSEIAKKSDMETPFLVDATGERFPAFPRADLRIVSLVPSLSELVHALGLADNLLGITNFCTEPPQLSHGRARVGGTKDFKVEKIRALAPTLVLANREENTREGVEALRAFTRVFVTDVDDLKGALAMVRALGRLCSAEAEAQALAESIELALARTWTDKPLRAAYFIWRKPYMVAGGGTFINDMMRVAGFENVFARLPRYPAVDAEQIAQAQPDVLLLSSEPYPFGAKHIAEFGRMLPGRPCLLVDGAVFSWYGSRLLHAPAHFDALWSQLMPSRF